MAYKVLNRAKQQATTQGTGAFTLGAVAAGMQAFVSANGVAVNGTTHYMAVNGSEWELGLGTLSAANTMQRTTVIESSNANALVNFSAPPTVFGTVPASQLAQGPVAFTATRIVAQACAAGAATKMLYANVETDTHGFYSAATSRFQPTVAGFYQVTATVTWGAANSSINLIYVMKNGVEFRRGTQTNAAGYAQQAAALVYLNGTTDYVEIGANTQVAVSTEPAAGTNHFDACLVAASGANGAATPVMFSARAAATQNLTANVQTKILYGTKEADTDGFYDAANSRFQPTRAGWYYVEGSYYLASTPGYADIKVNKNGNTVKVGSTAGNSSTYFAQASTVIYLNGTTDYVEIFGSVNANVTTNAAFAAGHQFSGFMLQASVGAVASNPSLPAMTVVKRAAALVIANATNVAVPFDTLQEDGAVSYSAGAPTRITVPAGKTRMRLTAGAVWVSGTTGRRWLMFNKNNVWLSDMLNLVNGAFETGQNLVSYWMPVVAGDYFEVIVRQDTGASLNVTAAWAQAEFA